jgi:hypothetical protein
MALRTEDPFLASPALPHERLRIAVTARRIAYLKLGYEPIPVMSGRKRPAINGWQDVRITIPPDEDVITPWADTHPGALSTGIRLISISEIGMSLIRLSTRCSTWCRTARSSSASAYRRSG